MTVFNEGARGATATKLMDGATDPEGQTVTLAEVQGSDIASFPHTIADLGSGDTLTLSMAADGTVTLDDGGSTTDHPSDGATVEILNTTFRGEDPAGLESATAPLIVNVVGRTPVSLTGTPIADQTHDQNDGVKTVDATVAFAGTVTNFAINPPVSGVSIASNGTISINTAATGVLTAQDVTVEATNELAGADGIKTDTFALTINSAGAVAAVADAITVPEKSSAVVYPLDNDTSAVEIVKAQSTALGEFQVYVSTAGLVVTSESLAAGATRTISVTVADASGNTDTADLDITIGANPGGTHAFDFSGYPSAVGLGDRVIIGMSTLGSTMTAGTIYCALFTRANMPSMAGDQSTAKAAIEAGTNAIGTQTFAVSSAGHISPAKTITGVTPGTKDMLMACFYRHTADSTESNVYLVPVDCLADGDVVGPALTIADGRHFDRTGHVVAADPSATKATHGFVAQFVRLDASTGAYQAFNFEGSPQPNQLLTRIGGQSRFLFADTLGNVSGNVNPSTSRSGELITVLGRLNQDGSGRATVHAMNGVWSGTNFTIPSYNGQLDVADRVLNIFSGASGIYLIRFLILSGATFDVTSATVRDAILRSSNKPNPDPSAIDSVLIDGAATPASIAIGNSVVRTFGIHGGATRANSDIYKTGAGDGTLSGTRQGGTF